MIKEKLIYSIKQFIDIKKIYLLRMHKE